MKNETILKKAIEKAVKNGWDYKPYWNLGIVGLDWVTISIYESKYFHIIFSHDFAKKFWGESKDNPVCGECSAPYDGYDYHLQQMVLEKDPIKYLEKYI